MYEIYIKETKLILTKTNKEGFDFSQRKDRLVASYTGKTKFLLNYIDMLEKGSKFKELVLHSPDKEKLIQDFNSLFRIVPAGGGLVINESDEILFIFRRGSWDLPKGKFEMYEKKKDAALREVMEETGIKGVSIIKKLRTTRHVFKTSNHPRSIKKTYWYLMKSSKQKLVPQLEEDITKAEWMSFQKFYQKERPVFKSIDDVLKRFEKKYLNKLK